MPTITLEKQKTKVAGLNNVPADLQELINRKPPVKKRAKKKLQNVNARYDFKKRSWCLVDDNNKVVSYHPVIVLADVTFVTVDVEHCAEKRYEGCGSTDTGAPCRRGHASGKLVGTKMPKSLPPDSSKRVIGFDNSAYDGGFYYEHVNGVSSSDAKTAGYLVLQNRGDDKAYGYFLNKR